MQIAPIQASSSEPAARVLTVNGRCQIIESELGERVVMVGGVAVFRMPRNDREAEDLFIVQALENGYAKAGQLADALGRPLRTVHHLRTLFGQRGAAGLVKGKRGPKGPRLGSLREAAVAAHVGDGLLPAEIARRLGVSRGTVVAAMKRLGLVTRPAPPQLELGNEAEPETSMAAETPAELAAPAAPAPPAAVQTPAEPVRAVAGLVGADPSDRSLDRMMAALGELEDAEPLFAPGQDIPRAGALLAVPVLVATGVFEEAEATFRSIGPAFYGLRTILLTLLLLALLRVKRPENLKEYSPAELGRILGLDRAPEVKTVRRKLSRLGDDEKCEVFLQRLVQRRIASHSEALGFLYVDGHVRVYHGQVDLPKTHVARLRLSLPSTQDFWLNDEDGMPVLVVTQEAHPSLTGVLRSLLANLRGELGTRRVTVVFDRGGWSPQLFEWMAAHGFDVLTYRKGASDPVPDAEFTCYHVQLPRGIVTYELHDCVITLPNGFEMRQVTRRQGAHQTQMVTTRRDLPVTEVAQRMFDRWRQENFFKYMREQYAIDALLEYGAEPGEPERVVPNPEWKKKGWELERARLKLGKLEAAYGAAVVSEPTEPGGPAPAGPDPARLAELGTTIRDTRAEIARLTEERRALPRRLPVGKVKAEVLRLPRGRKRLADGLKMLAYQAEADLARAIAPYYPRSLDEGRRLIVAALQSAGDLILADGELHVRLAPQSSPHRTRALAKLCEILTATSTPFPGTTLRLRYTVRGV